MTDEDKPTPARDWKGIAALITSLVAVAAFVSAEIRSCRSQEESYKVQAESYNELATKLAVLQARLDGLDSWAKIMFPAGGGRLPSPALAGPPAASKPPEQLMQKAGIPTFAKIKERAQAKE
jgi:hypothetical protein